MYFDAARRQTLLDGPDTANDYFEVDHITYQALPLDPQNWEKGIGINSSVFRARAQDDDDPRYVVKVCNFGEEISVPWVVRRRKRFSREISAMQTARDLGKENLVVMLLGHGAIRMSRGDRTHQCFVMEAADRTLNEHLSGAALFTMQQRVLLCVDLLRCVKALHDIGVYHRDLKPENIFFIGNQWKVGDLGLVGFRGEDAELDGREKIGPPKWMSPEAFNRAYCLLRADNAFIDRVLDDRSDVYQLGKLWWYVMQGDIPNGCLHSRDLVYGSSELYGVFLKPMLQYRRSERPTLNQLERKLAPLMRSYTIA